MKTVVRKIGNSAGIIIPAEMLSNQGFAVGSEVDLNESKTGLEITATKPRYTLAELLDQCRSGTSLPKELHEWDAVEPVGNEIL